MLFSFVACRIMLSFSTVVAWKICCCTVEVISCQNDAFNVLVKDFVGEIGSALFNLLLVTVISSSLGTNRIFSLKMFIFIFINEYVWFWSNICFMFWLYLRFSYVRNIPTFYIELYYLDPINIEIIIVLCLILKVTLQYILFKAVFFNVRWKLKVHANNFTNC